MNAFAEQLKTSAAAAHVLPSETGRAERQTCSLFQGSSSAGVQTTTNLKGFEAVRLSDRSPRRNARPLSFSSFRASQSVGRFNACVPIGDKRPRYRRTHCSRSVQVVVCRQQLFQISSRQRQWSDGSPKQHSAWLTHLASRICAIMKFGAGAGDDPVVKVKGLITGLFRLPILRQTGPLKHRIVSCRTSVRQLVVA